MVMQCTVLEDGIGDEYFIFFESDITHPTMIIDGDVFKHVMLKCGHEITKIDTYGGERD